MQMCRCRRIKLLATSFVGLLLASSVVWAEAGANAYTISRGPTRAALVVKVSIPQTGLIRSMTLYGDNRLVLLRHGSGQQIFESHVLKLEPNEVEALMRIVVDHDLPDYDETDILARQIRADAEDGLGHIGADGADVFVDIMLESYTKSGKVRENLTTKIHVEAPKSAARVYPDIREFHGITLLTRELYAYWEQAGGTRW